MKEQIRTLIGEGNLEDALELLLRKNNNSSTRNDILLLSSKLKSLNRENIMGLISISDYNLAKSKITLAILTTIEEKSLDDDYNYPLPSAPPPPSKRKILFLSANPKNSGQLRLGEELRKIKDSLYRSTYRDSFSLESEPAVMISTITRAIQYIKPEIVHFSGHGTGENGIVVENEIGDLVMFPTEGLNRLFRVFKDVVKCVVLNACYSVEQAKEISKHGIYVVGMNSAIGDKAAIDFALGFYQSLGEANDNFYYTSRKNADFELAFEMAMVVASANLNDANTPELWHNGAKLENRN